VVTTGGRWRHPWRSGRWRGATWSDRWSRLPGVALLIAIVLTLGFAAHAHATFSAATANAGNAWQADALAPPSNLGLSVTCGSAAAAPTFRSMTQTVGTSNSVNVNRPAGVVAGDLLIAAHAVQDASVSNAPSDWTAVRATENNSGFTLSLYYKVATASEPATYPFSITAGTSRAHVIATLAYSGVDTSRSGLASGVAFSTTNTLSAGAVATTTANNRVVVIWSLKAGDTGYDITPTNSLTNRVPIFHRNGQAALRVDEKLQASAGSGTTETGTVPWGNNPSIGAQIALPAPVSSTRVDATWTASPSTWATGYRLERVSGGTVQSTVTVAGSTSTSGQDSPVSNGTYTYRLYAYRSQWQSATVSGDRTVSC